MPVLWRVLLLWVAACICLQVQAQEALIISRRETLTQETKEAMDTKSVKKRSTTSMKMVEVHSLKVACTVKSRFSHTVITSKAVNNETFSQETFFEVELPKTAFITKFSMEIDSQVYSGEVKGKDEAKKQYDKAVSSGATAGLVKPSGRKVEKFSMSVNIAAKRSVTFVLIYEELLQRKLGQYEILTRVKPKQPVQDFQIIADIFEPQGISFVGARAPFFKDELFPSVKRSKEKVQISFSPTLEQQKKCPGCNGTIMDGDLIIKYDVYREEVLGEVQVANGYFVHFFAPSNLPRVKENVVFVIDRSASMRGTKIAQTRDALGAILKELHEEDHFALIMFDEIIITWKDSLTKATKENVNEAIAYVQELRQQGSTNINDAVLKAVSMLVSERNNMRLPERSLDIIFLLTDGVPNRGETNLQKIQENVHSAIGGNMTMFCLGFGNDADYSFLDMLCKKNKGLARRIFLGSDAASQLKGFYKEVSDPLLLEVDLRYSDNAVNLTNNHYNQLFNGSEIVVAGQLRNKDMDKFLVEVFAHGNDNDFKVQGNANVVNWDKLDPVKKILGNFIERLWAYLTIQQLMDKGDIGTQEEKSSTAAKALGLSMQYGFLTPLTSMLVTKPESGGVQRLFIADKLTEDQRQKAEKESGLDTMTDVTDDSADGLTFFAIDAKTTPSTSVSVRSTAAPKPITHLFLYTGLFPVFIILFSHSV
ncbi:Inter-alpha-trypsin inhibitor heavy chain H3 [Channa argus]|uniref:Inter-alpha-trypsin inhibitor heavy chain H3 n=2 Tax=Channa argus TaxID=215402 RepID=A0A6G1PHQ4_CHAAH|nr:Inter-alpha-trypsin inhibitor heavy chain H3 [Channa argus]